MIKRLYSDDIFIGKESFHPACGSTNKKEAEAKADSIRKAGRYQGIQVFGVRLIHREKGIHFMEKGVAKPFKGWAIFVKFW